MLELTLDEGQSVDQLEYSCVDVAFNRVECKEMQLFLITLPIQCVRSCRFDAADQCERVEDE